MTQTYRNDSDAFRKRFRHATHCQATVSRSVFIAVRAQIVPSQRTATAHVLNGLLGVLRISLVQYATRLAFGDDDRALLVQRTGARALCGHRLLNVLGVQQRIDQLTARKTL